MFKLLLVEDEVITREALSQSMRWQDLQVGELAEASNGKQALALVGTFRPDIIVTDVRMPEMSGIELAAELERMGSDASLIMMSAYSDMNYMKSAIKLHAVDYLLKPVDVQELEQAVRTAIERRKSKSDQHQIHAMLQMSLPVLREQFLNSLLQASQPVISREELSARCRSLQLPRYVDECFRLVLVPSEEPAKTAKDLEAAWNSRMGMSDTAISWSKGNHALMMIPGAQEPEVSAWSRSIEQTGGRPNRLQISDTFESFLQLGEVYSSLLEREAPIAAAGYLPRERESLLIQSIKSYIASNYWKDQLSILEMANELNYTSAYICMIFKKATGDTLNHYLNEYRLQKAKELMNDVTLKIADVAALVGYSSENYFSKVFRKYEGLSPSDYRRGGI
ncbi:response regulator [Paenibacillus koleovorans]|uniref:response regulator n=1 Tax=Paenibacillus koleovorans TaxID=121608 RepID=UPI0013E3FE5F|nr:response regulator [Paenibacillus koleovorans]